MINRDEDLKHIFLCGWEVKLNGDEQCEAFLNAQRSTEENANNSYSGIELVYKNSRLVEAFQLEEGEKEPKDLENDEIGLAYEEYPIHPVYRINDSADGLHQLGGKIPEDVMFPDNNCNVPFQYIGYISNRDENFKWLPSVIHLMCPIFLSIDMVYLDYTNPNKPEILNRKELEQVDTECEGLNKQSIIEYNLKKYDLVELHSFGPINVRAGVPEWIQNPTFPKCPKSGKTMKFLCQISGGVTTSYTNVKPKEGYYQRYFEKLNFWGDGELYVFVEPAEKTVCYFIQST